MRRTTAAGALGENCAELAGIGSRLAQSLSGQAGDLDDAQELFDEIADQVPDEIKDDYEVVAENFGKIAEGLKDLDLGSGATPSAEDLAEAPGADLVAQLPRDPGGVGEHLGLGRAELLRRTPEGRDVARAASRPSAPSDA